MIEKKKNLRQLNKEQYILQKLKEELYPLSGSLSKIQLADTINVAPEMLSAYGKTKMPSLITFALLCEDLDLDANEILGITSKTNR